jgi:hypothetical protein
MDEDECGSVAAVPGFRQRIDLLGLFAWISLESQEMQRHEQTLCEEAMCVCLVGVHVWLTI